MAKHCIIYPYNKKKMAFISSAGRGRHLFHNHHLLCFLLLLLYSPMRFSVLAFTWLYFLQHGWGSEPCYTAVNPASCQQCWWRCSEYVQDRHAPIFSSAPAWTGSSHLPLASGKTKNLETFSWSSLKKLC